MSAGVSLIVGRSGRPVLFCWHGRVKTLGIADMQEQHYHGHRKRLRKRFLQQGLEGFQDYEALELLLLFVARQQDMKPIAKALIERFGSFKNVLDASSEKLQAVEGVGPAAVTLIHFVKQAAAQQTSQARFSPDSPEALIEYCIVSMGAESNEKFRDGSPVRDRKVNYSWVAMTIALLSRSNLSPRYAVFG